MMVLCFVLVDIFGLLLGCLFSYYLRFHAGLIPIELNYDPRAYAHIIVIAIPVWLFWLYRDGCYESVGRAFNREIMMRVMRACFRSILTFVVAHFFMRNLDFSRYVYFLAFVLSIFGIGIARFLTDRVLAFLRRRGVSPYAQVGIIGLHDLGLDIAGRIKRHNFLGLQVCGFIRVVDDASQATEFGEYPILGSLADLPQLVETHRLRELIVNAPELAPDDLADLVFECEKLLVAVRIAPILLQHRMVQLDVEQVDGIPLYGLKQTPMTGAKYYVKRVFDFFVSAMLLLICGIPMVVIALCIKATSTGPIFYFQTRVSLDNREFELCKFRSMVENAATVATAENDERVTVFGRFLRSTSLDELPQLWNVLRGDMSLVGPRPERPHLVEQHRDAIPRYMSRLRVPAGITGLAQINGFRQGTSLDRRIERDIEYIENWSLWLDIKILLLTLLSFNRNAY